MNIHNNIKIIDLGLLIDKTLIICDIHIGFEESLNKQGILIPRFQFTEIIKRLEKILEQVKVNNIIINGDIKHEFGRISEQEWRHTLKLLDFLAKYGKVILIKGNHDNILGPIAKKRNVEVKDYVILKDILVIHGDKLNKDIEKLIKKSKIIIIGHEHPAITLKDSPRIEKYKCFLKGKFKRKTLIVQPSFNLVTEGTDITKVLENQRFSEPQKSEGFLMEKTLSPFLQQNLDNFNVYIVADKVYDFRRLRGLK